LAEYGQTAAQIMSDLRTVAHYTDDDAHNTLLLSWMNAAIREICRIGDWPDSKNINATLTTDGAASYDLTAETSPGPTFGRIVAGTVRMGVYHIWPMSKSRMDKIDPDRTHGGIVSHYDLINKKTLVLWPAGSDGDTLTFDWIAYPAKIDADTTEANMPFDPAINDFIFEGAAWRVAREVGQSDWYTKKRDYFKSLESALLTQKPVRLGSNQTIPVVC